MKNKHMLPCLIYLVCVGLTAGAWCYVDTSRPVRLGLFAVSAALLIWGDILYRKIFCNEQS